jgi:hypothetical protein
MNQCLTVFFAIPCGEFYSIQKKIIRQVEKTLKEETVINYIEAREFHGDKRRK